MKVALCNMPYGPVDNPSIQLAILKALLNDMDIESKTFLFNVDFARKVNAKCLVMDESGSTFVFNRFIAEWAFARLVWGPGEINETFIQEFPNDKQERFQPAADAAESFIDELMDYNWEDYDIVAFTCTYPQNLSSFAFSKRLKEKYPHITTIFGGANFFEDGSEEYIKHIPWIDYIFIGEAEDSFTQVMSCFKEGKEIPEDIKGVMFEKDGQIIYNGLSKPLVENSPLPDYTDFCNALPEYDGFIRVPRLNYEASRGCWYGDAKRCKFCGLNFQDFTFRYKSTEKVVRELKYLKETYNPESIIFVDNIVCVKHLKEVFPQTQGYGPFFLMAKPDDFTPSRLKMLKAGGLKTVYTGIEALNRNLLDHMNKNQTIMSAVCLLKWSKFFSIRVHWSLIIKVPFAKKEDYDAQLEVLRKIRHLSTPKIRSMILVKYGQYYEQKLVPNIRPAPSYKALYPEYIDLDKVAQTFYYDEEEVTVSDEDMIPTIELVKQGSKKSSVRFEGTTHVRDTRDDKIHHPISPEQYMILKECGIPIKEQDLKANQIDLDYLMEKDLLFYSEGEYMSLVEVEPDDPVERPKTKPTEVKLPVIP